MSTKFGRVEMPSFIDWTASRNDDGEINAIAAILYDADGSTDVDLLRTNLKGHQGDYISIVDDSDTTVNGFYYVLQVNIREHEPGSGVFDFDAQLEFKGDYGTGKGQSILNRIPSAEDFTITEEFWWAPPVDALAVEIGDADSVDIDRDILVDGSPDTISVSTEIDDDCNPTWSVDPEDIYKGGCYVHVEDKFRVGRRVPMDPTDWYIGNGIMEIRPSVYQGASDGGLQYRFHDDTDWGAWTEFEIRWAGTNDVPSWNFFRVLWYQPELVAIRLERDASEAPFSQRKVHQLDIQLRRGGVLAPHVYKFSGAAATHAIESQESSTLTRSGGTAQSYVTVDDLLTSGDGTTGDRLVYGCPNDFTESGMEIELDDAATLMKFWVGAAIHDAANGSGNGPADLAKQFVGMVAERVRIVER